MKVCKKFDDKTNILIHSDEIEITHKIDDDNPQNHTNNTGRIFDSSNTGKL